MDKLDYMEPNCPFDVSAWQNKATINCEKPLDIRDVLSGFDALVDRNDGEGAAEYLEYWRREAQNRGDLRGEMTLLSEMMGFYRQQRLEKESLNAVKDGLALLQKLSLQGESAGTILINAATALCAFGRAKEAIGYYAEAFRQYGKSVPENDWKFASLCNNMASAYLALEDDAHAEAYYRKALKILNSIGDKLDYAVTCINLAQLKWKQDPEAEDIQQFMDEAWECFDDPGVPRNGYYAQTCRKSVDAFKFFGYFYAEKELRRRMEEIYAGA